MKSLIKRVQNASPVFVLLLALPLYVHAQTNTFPDPLGGQDIATFLNKILDIVILVMVPIIVLAIIYAGYLFVSSQGNETDISKAKTILWWTIIGALIILGAKVLATAIQGTVKDIRTASVYEQGLTLSEHPLNDA